jgi:hypothetical protein
VSPTPWTCSNRTLPSPKAGFPSRALYQPPVSTAEASSSHPIRRLPPPPERRRADFEGRWQSKRPLRHAGPGYTPDYRSMTREESSALMALLPKGTKIQITIEVPGAPALRCRRRPASPTGSLSRALRPPPRRSACSRRSGPTGPGGTGSWRGSLAPRFHLFSTSRSGTRSVGTLKDNVARVLRAANLKRPGECTHVFRAAHASIAIGRLSGETVAALSGHRRDVERWVDLGRVVG